MRSGAIGSGYERDRGDRRAVELMKRGLAHDLRYHEGMNADGLLRDLAETYLRVDDLDRGQAVLAGLLRNDPSDIWTYNVMAIIFDRFGLTDLGLEASQRGLELVEATGDPERLHDQLVKSVGDMRQSESRGREARVAPTVLADLRAALALGFDAGQRRPVTKLCWELVPGAAPGSGAGQAPERKIRFAAASYAPAASADPTDRSKAKAKRTMLVWQRQKVQALSHEVGPKQASVTQGESG